MQVEELREAAAHFITVVESGLAKST